MRARAAVEDQMYGRTHKALLGEILGALAKVYRLAVWLRGVLYRMRIFRRRSLPCPVVSVGNITLGGTGKTPMVVMLGGMLAAKGKRPIVVSRGYGREKEQSLVVVSDGASVVAGTKEGGDEPVLIASRLPGVPVVCGANRFEAGAFGIERFKSDVVILDDGFQHVGLKRNLDIVLVDAMDPFGNGKLFPAGILREPIHALQRAQAVILTKADQSPDIDALKETIRSATRARLFTAFQRPLAVVNIITGETRQTGMLRGVRTLVFSGIARPAAFTALLKSIGASISQEIIFPDHYAYEKSDLATIYQKAADVRAGIIVTTEKDSVRLKPLKAEGIWALRMELAVTEEQEWDQFIAETI